MHSSFCVVIRNESSSCIIYKTAQDKVCVLSWVTGSWDIAIEFFKCMFLELLAPQAECHLVLLYGRESRLLYSQYFQNSASPKQSGLIISIKGKRWTCIYSLGVNCPYLRYIYTFLSQHIGRMKLPSTSNLSCSWIFNRICLSLVFVVLAPLRH